MDDMSWQMPAFWLLLSFLVAMGLRLSQHMLHPAWRKRLHWLRWLLIPYLGLLTGGISPRLMGLSAIDWQISLSLGLSICFGVLIVLALVRSTVASGLIVTKPVLVRLEEDGFPIPTPAERVRPIGYGQPSALQATLVRGLQAGAEEWQWCFLRSAIGEMIQNGVPLLALSNYWVVWIAGGVAAFEVLVSRPALLQTPPALLLKLCQLLSTTVLFFYTRNFWLCWFLHTAIAMLFSAFLANKPQPVDLQ